MALARKARSAAVPLLAVALSIGTGACGNDGPTSPRPSFLSGGGGSYHVTPTNSNQTVGPIDLGSYPEWTLIHVVTSGSEDALYTEASYPGHAGELIATLDAGGFYYGGACYANVEVQFTAGIVGYCTYPGVQPPLDQWVLVRGQGNLYWNAREPKFSQMYYGVQTCGPATAPCHNYESSGFDVSIDKPDVDLVVKPDRYTVVAPGSVKVNAQPATLQFGGVGVPFRVQSWQWQPDNGGTAAPACPPQTDGIVPAICQFSPSSSGTLTVTALVNGDQKVKAVHIRVLCESTGDSLLDSLPILDAMRMALLAGNSGDPLTNNRREMQWGVLCDGLGCAPVVYPADANTSPCSSTPIATTPSTDTTGTRVTGGHTHPNIPIGSSGAEPWPSVCGTPKGIGPGPYGFNPGPSRSDYTNAAKDPTHWHFIPDSVHIWAMPPSSNPDTIQAHTDPIPRKTSGGCTRL
jgi:hypothetical protein